MESCNLVFQKTSPKIDAQRCVAGGSTTRFHLSMELEVIILQPWDMVYFIHNIWRLEKFYFSTFAVYMGARIS